MALNAKIIDNKDKTVTISPASDEYVETARALLDAKRDGDTLHVTTHGARREFVASAALAKRAGLGGGASESLADAPPPRRTKSSTRKTSQRSRRDGGVTA